MSDAVNLLSNSGPLVEAAASLISVVVAIVALWVAFRGERRSQDRFQAQLDQAKASAEASIRPIVTVYSQVYTDLKSVNLANRGIGPAVINRVQFSKGETKTTALVELFDLGTTVAWDTFRRFPPEGTILPPGQDIALVKLSQKALVSQGKTVEDALSILSRWQRQKKGIKVEIEYENAMGTQQKTYSTTLK